MLNDSKTGFMGRKKAPYISKSTYLMGLQCQKLIWFRYNAKDQIPAPDESTQAVSDQGTEVGELARQLFPGGTVVAPGIIEPDEVIAETQKAIQARRPLYEAAFVFHGGYPERFAQEALGHNSKAVHRAYAKRALMKIPSLEDYEQRAA